MGIRVEEANPPQGPQLNADGTPIQFNGPWPPLNVIQYPVYLSIAPAGITFQKVADLQSYQISYGVMMGAKFLTNFHFFTGSLALDTTQLWSLCYSHLKSLFPAERFRITDSL